MTDAVVFDLDGLLLDTEQLWDEVREELARERGGTWSERAQADMMGMSSPEWSAYMHEVVGLADAPDEIAAEVVRRMSGRYRDQLPLLPGAREAVERLRRAGVRVGVVSNQSGVARGLITRDEVAAVNRRVDELVGPLDAWAVCHHGPEDGCDCRKPRPGLVLRAAEQLGVEPERCAVIGDIGADVEAARAAGARGVLVPTPITRREEVDAAPIVAPDIASATDLLLGGAR